MVAVTENALLCLTHVTGATMADVLFAISRILLHRAKINVWILIQILIIVVDVTVAVTIILAMPHIFPAPV